MKEHYLQGIAAADSITCDAHKWFSVSMGAGMFFCKHPESQTVSTQGEVWISATQLRKTTPALRACITSFRTTPADVEFLVQALDQALKE